MLVVKHGNLLKNVAAERLTREVETIRSRELDRERPAPSAADVTAALREVHCTPAGLPPVTALATAQDGTIWIRREDAPDADTVWWDVLGAGGDRIARLALPAGETVSAARGDVLVTRWTDDLGVPYLTRYRLIR